MKKLTLAAALISVASGASAADVDQLGSLLQPEFRALSEDLGAALSYKAVAPAEPLGITGFDLGVEVTATTLENKKAFDAATSGNSLTTLPVGKVHLHKGLPFGIDVGYFYASVPDSNITLNGAELRYAVVEGGVLMPAVAVRATYSVLGGVDQLDLNTKGLELTVSKGFAMLTPYAGVGNVWVDSKPKADAAAVLDEEKFDESKLFAGLNFNAGLMNFAFEGDQTGDATTYSAKFGFRW